MKNWLWTFLFLSLGAQAVTMNQLIEQKFNELFRPGVEGDDWFSEMAYDGHKLRLIKDGPEVLEERVKLIGSAKRSILFSTYIIDVDETSDKFARAMCYMAKKKGIDVRMMVDSYGGGKFYSRYANGLRNCGVGIVEFASTYWGLEHIVKSLHEKLLIIDGEKVYMGGRGVQNSYHHVAPAHKFFHDMDIIIEGPVACWWHLKYLQTYHRTRQSTDQCYDDNCRPRPRELDALLYGKHSYPSCSPVVKGNSRVLPVYGNPILKSGKTDIEDVYIKALENLEIGAEVKLYSPYFVPTKRFGSALIKAKREKQAQISVITNSIESNDEGVGVLVAMIHEIPYLLKEGINVRVYPGPQTLHRKVGIFGGKYAHIGSDNLDNRGQHHQSESVVLTDDQTIIEEIEMEFDKDFDQSSPLTPAYIKKIDKKGSNLSGWLAKVFREYF